MIRLGIDARSLSGQISGVGRYTLEIVRELSTRNIEIILYCAEPFHIDLGPAVILTRHSRFKNKYLKFLWNYFYLGICVRSDFLDMFWEPSHRFPFFLPVNLIKILTIHDLVWIKYPSSMKYSNYLLDRFLMPRSLKIANSILTVSNSTKNDLVDKFPELAKKPIYVTYLGITNLSFGSQKIPRVEITIKLSKEYILFVGTLDPRKNLIRLITAFARLNLYERREIKLYIVGRSGWGMAEIFSLIESLILTSAVEVFLDVTDAELSLFYENALFLALPSLYEGFGLPLVEALYYGLPILTSNNSSLPEVAGSAALLVNPLDIDSITSAIRILISDSNYRNTLSSASIKRSVDFSWHKTTDKIYSIFNNLVDHS